MLFMFKKNILIFVLFYFIPLGAFSIKDRLIHAGEGDYFVLKSGKMTSIIRVVSLEERILTLEEISAPANHLQKISWQDWIDRKAPGHTSWVLYEIDLNTDELIEAFSLSKGCFLQLNDTHFLLTLLKSPLQSVPKEDRKKIGPPPQQGEIDIRADWQPPKIVNGKKASSPKFSVYQMKWPADHTELSGKVIQLYFEKSREFFFPFWVEVLSDHLTLPLKVIDCGHDLCSLAPSIPRRAIQFLTTPKKTQEEITFYVNCPKYYNEIQLFALDRSQKVKKFIEIPVQINRKENEKLELIVSIQQLSALLEKKHSYAWIIKPKGSQLISELEEPFYFDK